MDAFAEALADTSLKRVYIQKQTLDVNILRQVAGVLDRLGRIPTLKTMAFLRRGFSSSHRMYEYTKALTQAVTNPRIGHLLQCQEGTSIVSSHTSTHYTGPQVIPSAMHHPKPLVNQYASLNSSTLPYAVMAPNQAHYQYMPTLQYPHGIHYGNPTSYAGAMQYANAAQDLKLPRPTHSSHYYRSNSSHGSANSSPPRRGVSRSASAFDAVICSAIVRACVQLSAPRRRLLDNHAFHEERVATMAASQRACYSLLCVSKVFYVSIIRHSRFTNH
jgi:hypothetical protein